MLVKVSDEQYNSYISRLSTSIHKAYNYTQLKKLQPSLIMAQRQATNRNRTFRVLCVLQDFNAKCYHFDKLHRPKGLSCTK